MTTQKYPQPVDKVVDKFGLYLSNTLDLFQSISF